MLAQASSGFQSSVVEYFTGGHVCQSRVAVLDLPGTQRYKSISLECFQPSWGFIFSPGPPRRRGHFEMYRKSVTEDEDTRWDEGA